MEGRNFLVEVIACALQLHGLTLGLAEFTFGSILASSRLIEPAARCWSPRSAPPH